MGLLPWKNVIVLSFFFTIWTVGLTPLQIISPSWLWNPFMWKSYIVFGPEEVSNAMKGICLNQEKPNLCLSENSWRVLSSDALSTRNTEDVSSVIRGLRYAREESGGLVVNVLSRDTVDSVPLLRFNIET